MLRADNKPNNSQSSGYAWNTVAKRHASVFGWGWSGRAGKWRFFARSHILPVSSPYRHPVRLFCLLLRVLRSGFAELPSVPTRTTKKRSLASASALKPLILDTRRSFEDISSGFYCRAPLFPSFSIRECGREFDSQSMRKRRRWENV